jgi:hypothetical protein
MKHKIQPISQAVFESLSLKPNWKVVELSPEQWRQIPNLPRPNDTITVYMSGSLENPVTWNGIQHVAACDVVAYEANPKTEKGEGPLNVYHCLFQKLQVATGGFEYLMHYPFNTGLPGHWPKLEDFRIYFEAMCQD